MTSLRRKVIDNVTRILDVTVMLVTFVITLYIHSPANVPSDIVGFFSFKINVINFVAVLLLIYIWLKIFNSFGLYDNRGFNNFFKESFNIFKAVTLGTILIGAVAIFLVRENITKQMLVNFWPLCFIVTIFERLLVRRYLVWLRQSGRNLRHVVFVGANRNAIDLAQRIMSRKELGYKLMGFIDNKAPENPDKQPKANTVCTIDELPNYLSTHIVDEVFIVLPFESRYQEIKKVITYCQEIGIICRMPSNWFEIKTARTSSFELDGENILTVYSGSKYQLEYLWLKRLIDVAISAFALLILSPLLLIISFLIKVTSKGPVFFRQERIGFHRRSFNMLKFRTMVKGAEGLIKDLEHLNQADGPAFKIYNDPRITAIGKWLRKTSLDELPQLINVLKGDMSLVGPRPLPVRDVNGIIETWQKRRFSMRPGLTCLWQIGERNNMPFTDWMKLDLEYIDNWSIRLDFKIMAKTLPAVVKGTGY